MKNVRDVEKEEYPLVATLYNLGIVDPKFFIKAVWSSIKLRYKWE